MSSLDIMPDEAVCLDCCYLLRGLPGIVCPECGRAFNPDDSSTYGLTGNSRIPLRIKVAVLLIVITGLLYAFAPRGILRGNINMTCSACGLAENISRWQLNPPTWIPFRYPGMSRTTSTPANDASTVVPCDRHRFNASVQSDIHQNGRFSGTMTFVEGERITWNGVPITLDTLSDVLYNLLERSNNGIGP